MGKRLGEEIRLKAVREALAGIKVGALARMYDVHPRNDSQMELEIIRDEVAPEEIPMTDEHLQELQRLQEIEAKYEKAMKILGEKELEKCRLLRELAKKEEPRLSEKYEVADQFIKRGEVAALVLRIQGFLCPLITTGENAFRTLQRLRQITKKDALCLAFLER